MFCQSNSNVELKEKIADVASISAFVESDFVDVQNDSDVLLETSHSLAFDRFNKQIRKSNTNYTLAGIPVTELYALRKDSSGALYLIMDVNPETVRELVALFGWPENLLEESELERGEFDFLHWNYNALSVWLNKDIFGNVRQETNDRAILLVTNMQLYELRVYKQYG